MRRASTWLGVWSRAVIGPAARRATPVWIGAFLVGAVIFGPTGMQPHDLTELAWHVPAVGGVLAAMWILLFVPTARVLVRAEGARYLRALPGPVRTAMALGAAALVALQLPWLVLWLVGDGMRGLGVVLALSLPIAAVAAWQPGHHRTRTPRWRRAGPALAGVYLRALRRRAGHALVRGAGLALLAGLAAALMIGNNALWGREAAVLGTAVIAIVLVPGWVGALLPLVEAHRATDWLAASLGISERTRVATLAAVVGAVYLAGAAIAVGSAALLFAGVGRAAPDTGSAAPAGLEGLSRFGWLVPVALAGAAAASLVATRAVLRAAGSAAAASQVVVGAMGASAMVVLSVGLLGALGVALAATLGAFALLTARPAS